MKIQDGALVTSQQRYDSSNRFISRCLISGVSFMSIPSIVFKKWWWGGGGGGTVDASLPVQGWPKKPRADAPNPLSNNTINGL